MVKCKTCKKAVVQGGVIWCKVAKVVVVKDCEYHEPVKQDKK